MLVPAREKKPTLIRNEKQLMQMAKSGREAATLMRIFSTRQRQL